MVEFLDTDGTVNGYVDCHGNIVGVASTTSWSAITSPTSNLVLSMGTHNTAWDYTAGGAGLLLDNTASATSSVQQDSPYLQIEGQAWTGSASRPDGFEIEHILSTNTALLTFIHTGGYAGETTGLSMPALDLQPIAAALLPAAASYPGWCLSVSNSTAITVEGQTCVDAGSGAARLWLLATARSGSASKKEDKCSPNRQPHRLKNDDTIKANLTLGGFNRDNPRH